MPGAVGTDVVPVSHETPTNTLRFRLSALTPHPPIRIPALISQRAMTASALFDETAPKLVAHITGRAGAEPE